MDDSLDNGTSLGDMDFESMDMVDVAAMGSVELTSERPHIKIQCRDLIPLWKAANQVIRDTATVMLFKVDGQSVIATVTNRDYVASLRIPVVSTTYDTVYTFTVPVRQFQYVAVRSDKLLLIPTPEGTLDIDNGFVQHSFETPPAPLDVVVNGYKFPQDGFKLLQLSVSFARKASQLAVTDVGETALAVKGHMGYICYPTVTLTESVDMELTPMAYRKSDLAFLAELMSTFANVEYLRRDGRVWVRANGLEASFIQSGSVKDPQEIVFDKMATVSVDAVPFVNALVYLKSFSYASVTLYSEEGNVYALCAKSRYLIGKGSFDGDYKLSLENVYQGARVLDQTGVITITFYDNGITITQTSPDAVLSISCVRFSHRMQSKEYKRDNLKQSATSKNP